MPALVNDLTVSHPLVPVAVVWLQVVPSIVTLSLTILLALVQLVGEHWPCCTKPPAALSAGRRKSGTGGIVRQLSDPLGRIDEREEAVGDVSRTHSSHTELPPMS